MWKNRVFGMIILAVGALLCFYPDARNQVKTIQTERIIKTFLSDNAEYTENGKIPDGYQEILAYNQSIFDTHQSGLTDAWSYEQEPIELENYITEPFGYIEIPVMDVRLPLYIGASGEHLSKGAAVLGQTSIPIGGINTNSVIAGHRGWTDGEYFLNIENLEEGDSIFITNPFETMEYTVTEIAVIEPDDVDSIRIQEKRDMITLITCHPYGSHGKYRYVVYCDRKTDQLQENTDFSRPSEIQKKVITKRIFPKIGQEEKVRRITGMLIMVILFCVLVRHQMQKIKKKREIIDRKEEKS